MDTPKPGRILCCLAAWAGIAAVYLATANISAFTTDTWAASAASYTIATTGDPDMRRLFEASPAWFLFDVGDQVVTNRFAGAVLIGVPFYFLTSLLLPEFSLWPGALAAAAATATSVILMWFTLGSLFTNRLRLAATAFFAFGTATWSVSADAQWSHTAAQVCLAAALFGLSRNRLVVAGIALGLAAASRPHLAVALPTIGLILAAHRRSVMPALKLGLGALPGIGLLLGYNAWVFGRWSPVNGLEIAATPGSGLSGGSGIAFLPENIAGFLLSPGRGVLVLYPVMLVLLPWVAVAWRHATEWERGAAMAGIAYALVQLYLNRYTGGGWFFGSRLSIEPLTLAFPILVRAWDRMPVPSRSRSLALILLSWTAVTHAFASMMPPPCSISGCTGDMSDAWSFYDVWILVEQLGLIVSVTLLVGLALISVLLLRAIQAVPDSAEGFRARRYDHATSPPCMRGRPN